jgi:hypothetical protein
VHESCDLLSTQAMNSSAAARSAGLGAPATGAVGAGRAQAALPSASTTIQRMGMTLTLAPTV